MADSERKRMRITRITHDGTVVSPKKYQVDHLFAIDENADECGYKVSVPYADCLCEWCVRNFDGSVRIMAPRPLAAWYPNKNGGLSLVEETHMTPRSLKAIQCVQCRKSEGIVNLRVSLSDDRTDCYCQEHAYEVCQKAKNKE